MKQPKIIYIEDNDENYKRYCGAAEFKPLGDKNEVIKFIEYSAYEKLKSILIANKAKVI